jgi:hypothetical protein
MRPRSALFDYQESAAAAAVERRRLALLLRPGYGKTVSTETALLDLDSFPALVVAPARVVETDVWGDEARAWEHLRHLKVQPLIGSPAKRKELLRRNADIDVVSYELFLWLSDEVNLTRRYKSIVWDELSKLRHAETRRFKRLRSKKGGIEIPTRLGLTGSPVGVHALGLWGQMYAVAGEAPLGPSFGAFQARYFRPTRMVRTAGGLRAVGWELMPGAQAEVFERIKRHSFALPPQPQVQVPPIRTNEIRLPMPAEHRRVSEELRKELMSELAGGATLEALNGSTIANKLRQLAGGSVWLDKESWAPVHDAKLDGLCDLVEELQGEPLLVAYWYQHEKERIQERLTSRGVRWATFAGVDESSAWNRRELEVLLVHPASAGMGLNLQKGGSTGCWFTLPWSYEMLEQTEGRLARTGQAAPWVTWHRLLCGPADDLVSRVVMERGEFQSALMAEVAG